MIKELVFCDIDGTLRHSDGHVTKENIETISKLKNIDVGFVLTSGRSRQFLIKMAKEVNTSNFIIATNGTDVYDYVNNIEIFKACINYPTIKDIYNFANNLKCKILFKCGDANYINYPFKTEIPAKIISDCDLEKIANEGVTQINVMVAEKQTILKVINMVENLNHVYVASRSNALIDKSLTHPKNKDYSIDINVKGCEKGTGILKLIEYLKVPKNKTISIGDGINDLSMYKVCGTNVAVDNSISKLKQEANFITSSNNENGVAEFLKTHYKIK